MSHTKPYSIKDFGPSDLLDSEVENERAVKVSLNNLTAVEQMLFRALSDLIDTNGLVLDQMKLMNARIEEAFETRINLEDVENAD